MLATQHHSGLYFRHASSHSPTLTPPSFCSQIKIRWESSTATPLSLQLFLLLSFHSSPLPVSTNRAISKVSISTISTPPHSFACNNLSFIFLRPLPWDPCCLSCILFVSWFPCLLSRRRTWILHHVTPRQNQQSAEKGGAFLYLWAEWGGPCQVRHLIRKVEIKCPLGASKMTAEYKKEQEGRRYEGLKNKDGRMRDSSLCWCTFSRVRTHSLPLYFSWRGNAEEMPCWLDMPDNGIKLDHTPSLYIAPVSFYPFPGP